VTTIIDELADGQVEEWAFVALAAHGLAGSVLDVPAGPFTPYEWFGLVEGCKRRGLVALLADAVGRGATQVNPAQDEELAVLEKEAAGLALLVEQRAVQVSALLTAADVPHRLLGAPTRSRLAYRHPGVRCFTTAQLLVAAHPRLQLPPDRRGVVIRSTVETGPAGAGWAIGLEQMGDPPTWLTLGGHQVPTVSIEEHLVLASLEVRAADRPDLGAQRDVAEMALLPSLDPNRVRRTAEAWGVVDEVALALSEVWRCFQLADRSRLSAWAARVSEPGVMEPRWLDTSLPGARSARSGRWWGGKR
jgi:hypothetical protein